MFVLKYLINSFIQNPNFYRTLDQIATLALKKTPYPSHVKPNKYQRRVSLLDTVCCYEKVKSFSHFLLHFIVSLQGYFPQQSPSKSSNQNLVKQLLYRNYTWLMQSSEEIAGPTFSLFSYSFLKLSWCNPQFKSQFRSIDSKNLTVSFL